MLVRYSTHSVSVTIKHVSIRYNYIECDDHAITGCEDHDVDYGGNINNGGLNTTLCTL